MKPSAHKRQFKRGAMKRKLSREEKENAAFERETQNIIRKASKK
jgi:hypothetical protein